MVRKIYSKIQLEPHFEIRLEIHLNIQVKTDVKVRLKVCFTLSFENPFVEENNAIKDELKSFELKSFFQSLTKNTIKAKHSKSS